MEKCKKCGNDFTPQKGLKSYCSLACRNSRERSEETKRKIGDGVLKSEKFWESVKNTKKWFDYKANAVKAKETWNKKILNADFETLSYERLKKRIVLEQSGKCNHCGIDSWN